MVSEQVSFLIRAQSDLESGELESGPSSASKQIMLLKPERTQDKASGRKNSNIP